jgi:2-polyprenyl-6-methoxyphenol hydroxylase-like FAD-dependent oxidoreductase
VDVDVVVVGAGPNGLLLAGELSLLGLRPVVLERLRERTGQPRANGLIGRVAQALDIRGLYARLSGGHPLGEPGRYFQFGGLALDLGALTDNPLYGLQIPQPRLERLLEEWALERGARIRRGHEFAGFAQGDDSVRVDVHGPDGDTYALTTAYLAGCDGAASSMRKLAGIGFPGTTDEHFVSRSGDVMIPESAFADETGSIDSQDGRLFPFAFNRTESGAFVFAPFQPGVHRVAVHEWRQPPAEPDAPLTLTELRAAVARVTGVDLPMTRPESDAPFAWRRRVGMNSRQAERYRSGRVLLAGDAAHVQSGVGAPGLNLGMQDVFNLGWKLAATVLGWAPRSLLDTYESERHPAGARVLMHTRAQTALLSPGSEITALRELFGELLSEPVVLRRIAELLAASDLSYEMPGGGGHPLVGGWMPDLRLNMRAGQSEVSASQRHARAVLLDFANSVSVEGWQDRVDLVRAEADDPLADAILVRPDGYVAWAGSNTGELTNVLRTWFGEPSATDTTSVSRFV